MSQPKNALAKHASVFLVGRIAQFGAYLVVLPAVTRLLSIPEYGIMSLALIVQQGLVSFADLGLGSVVAFPIFDREPHALERSVRLVVAVGAVAFAVLTVVFASGPIWSQMFASASFDTTMQLAVVMAFPMLVQSACLSILQAQARPKAFVASTLVSTVGGQSLGLLLLVVDPVPTAYMLGLIAGSVAGAAIAAFAVPLRIVPPAPWPRFVAGIRHGGPTVPHNISFLILLLGDRVIIDQIMGIDASARYQVAYLVGTLGFSVLYALNNAWAPFVFAQPLRTRWKTLAETTDVMATLVTGMIVVVALGSPLALRVAAPADFHPNELVAPVALIVAALFFDLRYLSGVHVLFRTKWTSPLLFIGPGAAIANVVLNLWLVPDLGLNGAALATLLGYAMAAVLARCFARRKVRVPWNWPHEIAMAIATTVAVVAGILLPPTGSGLVVRLVIAGAAALVTVRAAWIRYSVSSVSATGI